MRNGSPGLQVRAFVEKYRLKQEVMEMQALIEEIAALIQKIKAGTATLGELEAFAAATNQLNERAIVLRYKAYEAKVYGASAPTENTQGSVEETPSAEVEETITAEPVAEVTSENEESVEIGFDLFSMEEEETSDATMEDDQPVEEEKVEQTDFESDSMMMDEEPTVEAPETTAVSEIQEAPVSEFTFEEEETTSASVLHEEPEFFEETPTPTIVQESVVSAGFNEHPVLRKALTNDGTLQSRLLTVRLETLKSAFGLNERLQIVKELFNGSNEAYSSAIEQLDNQAEKASARSLVNNLAHTYSWDVESDLAVEFVQKVERRYA